MNLPTTQSEAMQLEDRLFMQETLPELMKQLRVDSPRQWGVSPSVQHIVEHLSELLYISRKDLNLPLMIPEDKVEKAQSFLWREGKMFRKGTRAPQGIAEKKELRFGSLEEALAVIDKNLKSFYEYYQDDESKTTMHPAFGRLDMKSWERLHHMHFVHHLAQFGVLEADMSADPKPAN